MPLVIFEIILEQSTIYNAYHTIYRLYMIKKTAKKKGDQTLKKENNKSKHTAKQT